MEKQNQSQKSDLGPNWAYRGRGLSNLLRMGHCAPTVMQTILDISSTEKEWLVRLSAGMPGGIGNTGFECGAVTSPLVLLGIHYGLREVDRGLPVIFDKGHALCHNFLACYNTLQCREIRGKDRFPRHCIGPVLRSPELFLDALDGNQRDAIPAGIRVGYSKLYRTWSKMISTAPRPCSSISVIPLPNTGSSSMPPRPSWAGRYSWVRPAARSPRA